MADKKEIMERLEEHENRLWDIRHRYEEIHGRDLLLENIELRLAQLKTLGDLIDALPTVNIVLMVG